MLRVRKTKKRGLFIKGSKMTIPILRAESEFFFKLEGGRVCNAPSPKIPEQSSENGESFLLGATPPEGSTSGKLKL